MGQEERRTSVLEGEGDGGLGGGGGGGHRRAQ